MKKNIKKVISAFLIMGMAVSSCSGVFAKDNAGSLSVLENFDGTSVNTSFITGNGSVVSDPADKENRVWMIENTSSGMTTLMTNLRPSDFLDGVPEEKTGKLTYEYKVYIPSDNPKDGSGYYPIVNNIKQYEGMNIANIRPNTVFRADWKQNATIEDGFDNWFSVEYIFDYSTMTFDAYAQGKQFEESTSFKDGLPSNKQYFDPVAGLHLRAYVPSGFKYYIDDVKVTYSDEEEKTEINQLITGISVKAVNIDNFNKETKSYEIELSESDFNSLSENDVTVTVMEEHNDIVPEITIDNTQNDKKIITVKAQKSGYSEEFTVVCTKEKTQVILPSEDNNTYKCENFDGEGYNTAFITGTGEKVQDPTNPENQALKIENKTAGMTTLMTNIKPLSVLNLPENKLGKLIYEYDVLYPSENPMDKGGYYSTSVQMKQYEGMNVGTFRPINAFYDSKNIIGINDGLGNWYRIRYIFDYETKTFDLYAQGKIIADDVSYENVPSGKKVYDPSEGLHLRAYVPSGFVYYIDNINVSYVEVTPDFVTGLKTYDGEEYKEVTEFSAKNYSYDAKVYGEYFAELGNIKNLVKVDLEEGYEDAEIEITEGKETDGVKPVTVIVSKPPYMKIYTVNYSTKLRPFYSGSLKEDFEGKTPASLEKFVSRTGGGTTEIISDDEEHGDVLKVVESQTANNYYFTIDATTLKPNGNENAKLIYEFDFKIDDKYMSLPAENKGETTPVSVKVGSVAIAYLRWFQIGVGSIAYKYNDGTDPSAYEWESIKIEIDCDTKEFKYYFDGSRVPVITTVNENLSFDDLFKLQLQWWNGTKNIADVYIDNVRVSYVVSHPDMIDEIKVSDISIAEFDNKNYIYNIDLYEDLYNVLTEENIDVALASGYEDTVVEKSIVTSEDMKVINITLVNGLYEVNYTINCFSDMRPAVLSISECESDEYRILFKGYIEDELGNPVSRPVTAIAYKKGEEPIGDATQYFGVVKSSTAGILNGDILIFDTEEEPKLYEMEILLDAYGIDAPVTETVLYVNNSQLEESVTWIKASNEDVLTYITTEDEENDVTKEENIEIFNRMNIWTEEYLNNPKMQDKMEQIANRYKSDLSTENIASFVNLSVMAVILSDENITEERALKLIKEYDSNIEDIIVSGESFADLSETEQKWVIKNLISRCVDKEFESAEDVISEIRTSMLLCKINNAAYTELEELILDNDDLLGEENIKDLKNQKSTKIKDKAMKTLVASASKNDFTSVDGFTDALADALSDAEKSKADSESTGGSSGGSSGGKKNPVALGGMDITTTVPVVQGGVFSDLGGYEWAETSILKLNAEGIVSGVGNGRFEPGRTITREEFSKLLCETFGYEKSEDICYFEDIPEGSWYEGYVMSANKHGVINGISDTVFGSGQQITRQDMVTMMYRALKAKGIEISGVGIDFEDSEEISDYAKDAVFAMTANGIVNGIGDNQFAPKASATRAEAAVIISRVIDTFLD